MIASDRHIVVPSDCFSALETCINATLSGTLELSEDEKDALTSVVKLLELNAPPIVPALSFHNARFDTMKRVLMWSACHLPHSQQVATASNAPDSLEGSFEAYNTNRINSAYRWALNTSCQLLAFPTDDTLQQ